ncbi:hypothetical protein GLU60_01370 [Nanohaloarchaea archaeon H01]|nr:hypothetical protein [Nanohaloarchaea archaeon H01]
MGEIYVKVEPDSEEFAIKERQIPEIKLEQPAENGKANAEPETKLEQLTGEKVGIVSGSKSRRKKIRFQMSEEDFRRKLGEK